MERATATPYFPNANQKQTRIVVTQIVAFAQIVLRIVEENSYTRFHSYNRRINSLIIFYTVCGAYIGTAH